MTEFRIIGRDEVGYEHGTGWGHGLSQPQRTGRGGQAPDHNKGGRP